jgi:hypothetical protein
MRAKIITTLGYALLATVAVIVVYFWHNSVDISALLVPVQAVSRTILGTPSLSACA